MSHAPEALTPRADAQLGLGTIVRLIFVGFGILATTLLARTALGVQFGENFSLFLDIVHDAVGLVAKPFEIMFVVPLLGWLRANGWVIDLQEHWKTVFVVLWLFFGAWARARFNLQYWREYSAGTWLSFAFHWIWGGTCALVASVLAGSAPLDSAPVLFWPMSFFLLFVAVNSARDAWRAGQPRPRAFWPAVVLLGIILSGLVAAGIIPVGPSQLKVPGPGLVILVGIVAGMGAFLLIGGLITPAEKDSTWSKRLTEPPARIGLDILSVLGGAAILVWIARSTVGA